MPLIELKTNLKSLKYGHDRPGGGNSGLPYIKTDINTFRLPSFDDGLIRGGITGVTNASLVDTLRISKFFLDFPKGPLFIAKQVGLQLSNPKLESKQLSTNSPTVGQGFLNNVGNLVTNVSNTVVNAVGPTRIYNLGVNTLRQIPVTALGGHIIRHGLLSTQTEDNKYEAVVKANNVNDNNRLLNLANAFKLGFNVGEDIRGIKQSSQLNTFSSSPTATSLGNLTQQQLAIDSYIAGPGSVYGIGTTLIRRFVNTNAIDFTKSYSESESGFPLIDGVRQAFTYIDPSTGKGAIPSDLGRYKNVNSAYNRSHHIGGNAYQGKVDQFGAFSDINAPENSNEEIAKRVDQSVYDNNYTLPDNKIPISAAITRANDGLKNKNPFYYGVSEFSSSIYARSGSTLTDKSNINVSLNTRVASNSDTQLSKQYAGNSRDNSGNVVEERKLIRDNKNNFLGVSKQYFFKGSKEGKADLPTSPWDVSYPTPQEVTLKDAGNSVIKIPPGVVVATRVPVKDASYKKYQEIINSRKLRETTYYDEVRNEVNAYGIFGSNTLLNNIPTNLTFTSNASPDSNSNIVYYNGTSLLKINKKFTWRNITREVRVGSGMKDEINLTPMFTGDAYFGKDKASGKNIRDLVKFRIQAVDTDSPSSGQWMVFRAYITSLSDDTSSEWNDVKYAGRGDKFYIYNGFTRKISVTFQVAALSEKEMKFIYQKLNFLMSNAMPDYLNGLMRGPLIRMTIGNWIDSQLGKLDSINLKPLADSSWEIALDEPEGGTQQLILPHIVEVSLNFTPIGSETAASNLISEKSNTTSHIAQNNTGDVSFQYIV